MSLLARFLARVPPGSSRGRGWQEEAASLAGAAYLFGDYDFHHLVPVESYDELQSASRRLSFAPDLRVSLLVPRVDTPNLLEEWNDLCKTHPVMVHTELRLPRVVVEWGGAVALTAVDALLRDEISRQWSGSAPNLRAARYLTVGDPDFVLYLFSNDLDALADLVLSLRETRLAKVLDHLDTTTFRKARVEAFASLLKERATPDHHVFQTTYTLLGFLPDAERPLDPGRIRDRLSRRPAKSMPMIFLSVFPGHDRDGEFHHALAGAEESPTATTSGIFDLIYRPPSRSSGTTQGEVLASAITKLGDLWDRFGPKTEHPTIYRSNTVWTTPITGHLADVHPHFDLDDRDRYKIHPLDLPHINGDDAVGAAVLSLIDSYNGWADNELAAGYVADMRPVLVNLAQVASTLADIRKEKPHVYQEYLDAFDDLSGRLEHALALRTHACAPTLRQESLTRPGIGFQKLLSIYSAICRQFVNRITPLLKCPVPTYVHTLGGVHSAQKHWYFAGEERLPLILVFEASGAHLLHPGFTVFPLLHEFMHELPLDDLLQEMPRAVLVECGGIVAKAAPNYWRGGVPEIVDALLHHHRILVDELGERPMDAAFKLVAWCYRRSGYLAKLFVGEGSLTIEQVEGLDRLRMEIGDTLEQLRRLSNEAIADVGAAFATEPRAYADTLRQLQDDTPARIDVLNEVVGILSEEQREPTRPLTKALADFGRRMREGLGGSALDRDIIACLTTGLSSMKEQQYITLLDTLRGGI